MKKKPASKRQAKAQQGVMNKDANSDRANDRKAPLKKDTNKREPIKQEKDAETDLAAPNLDSHKRKVAQEKLVNGRTEGRVPDAKKVKTAKAASKETQTPLRRGRSAARK